MIANICEQVIIQISTFCYILSRAK